MSLAGSLPLYLPFVAQGALLVVDEARFHARRDLPRWERIGHPVDTAVFLAALLVAALAPHSAGWAFPAFCAAAVLSCLVITKDEWVHAERCPAGEHFVHALLFLVHPVALFAAWRMRALGLPMLPVLVAIALFGIHQLVYWNLLRKSA